MLLQLLLLLLLRLLLLLFVRLRLELVVICFAVTFLWTLADTQISGYPPSSLANALPSPFGRLCICLRPRPPPSRFALFPQGADLTLGKPLPFRYELARQLLNVLDLSANNGYNKRAREPAAATSAAAPSAASGLSAAGGSGGGARAASSAKRPRKSDGHRAAAAAAAGAAAGSSSGGGNGGNGSNTSDADGSNGFNGSSGKKRSARDAGLSRTQAEQKRLGTWGGPEPMPPYKAMKVAQLREALKEKGDDAVACK